MSPLSNSDQSFQFDQAVAIITGAGRGLGRAYAMLLASRGARVVVNDAKPEFADEVVTEIKDLGGVAVSDYSSVVNGESVINTALAAFGQIDILICNAGILRDRSFAKMTESDWNLVMDVHLQGTFSCVKAAYPHFLRQQYGRIVFVTSSSGLFGNFGQSNYAAAKMGILGLCESISRSGQKHNILCNAIAPIALSQMTEGLLPPDLGELLTPASVAPLVAYLVHKECRTTGAVYELAGGWYSRLRLSRPLPLSLLSPSAAEAGPTLESVSHSLEKFSSEQNSGDESNVFRDAPGKLSEATLPLLRTSLMINTPGGPGGPSLAALEAVYCPESLGGSGGTSEPLPPRPHPLVLPALAGGRTGVCPSRHIDVARALVEGAHFPPILTRLSARDACIFGVSVLPPTTGPCNSMVLAEHNDLDVSDSLDDRDAPGEEVGFRPNPMWAASFPHNFMEDALALPHLPLNPLMCVHGEHELWFPVVSSSPSAAVIPVPAELRTEGGLEAVFDRGRHAALVIHSRSSVDGRLVAVNRATVIVRGLGGFQHPPASPETLAAAKEAQAQQANLRLTFDRLVLGSHDIPILLEAQARLYRNAFLLPGKQDANLVCRLRANDFLLPVATSHAQALLFRLNGDRNPLHVDPAFAAAAGYPKPILHGLATLSISVSAISRLLCGLPEAGAPVEPMCQSVADIVDGGILEYTKGRFTGHVFPGETLFIRGTIDPAESSPSRTVVLFRVYVLREEKLFLVLDFGHCIFRLPQKLAIPRL